MKHDGHLPRSRHFALERLADGVYAAIHRHGGWAIGNSGIVDLGGRTMVFDSTLTPQAAAELRAAAEELTGQPVSFVINSHFHNDHIWGNQAFAPQTDIIATMGTLQTILTQGEGMYIWYRDNAATELERLQAQHESEQDEALRREVFGWIAYHQGLVESFPALQVRPPNITFEGRMTLQGSERAAELVEYQGGHSPSDAVLALPAEGILFTGDLLFIASHPYLGGGDPQQVLCIMQRLGEQRPDRLVPGHGPVGTAAALGELCEYIGGLDRLAQELVAAGKPEDAVGEVAIPERYAGWVMPSFFAQNLRFLYRRHAREDATTIA